MRGGDTMKSDSLRMGGENWVAGQMGHMLCRSFAALVALVVFGATSLALCAGETNSSAHSGNQPPPNKFAWGRDVVTSTNDVHGSIVVVGGNANLRGHVKGSVIVVRGKLDLDGVVESNVVIVAGSARLGPKAHVKENVIWAGSGVKLAPTAEIDQGITQFDAGWVVDWAVQGPLMGRPFPPRVPMAWLLALGLLLLYLALAALFPRSAQAAMDTLEQRPLASLFVGLLTLLLMGPLLGVLVISRAGVPVIPFALSALLAGIVFGKLAVYQFGGQRLAAMMGSSFLKSPLAALSLGVGTFSLAYMVPWLGFMVLHLVTIIGLGAAVLAALRNLRRESARAVVAPTGSDTTIAGRPPVIGGEDVLPPINDPSLWPRVGFWRRLLASLVDLCVLVIVLVPLKKIWLLVWLTYHIVLWATKGTTVGGLVMRIKVVREDGRPVTTGVAVVRALAGLVSALALFLGFFWAGWSREKRGWHDRFAGTIVVKVPKGIAD